MLLRPCSSASICAAQRPVSLKEILPLVRMTNNRPLVRHQRSSVTARASSGSTAAVPTLIYFEVPGRGEIARLCFTLGGVEFVDQRVPFPEWGALKPTTPFGQLPLLKIKDTVVAQSAAIDHYAARQGGFIPSDPLAALLADQAYFFVTQDIHAALISPTMKLQGEAAVNKRREIAAGALQDKLKMLEKLVDSRPGKYIAGDELSIGDLAIFNFLGMIKSDFWSGITADSYSHFKSLVAFRNEVASHPEVKAIYDKATDRLRTAGYRPDEAA